MINEKIVLHQSSSTKTKGKNTYCELHHLDLAGSVLFIYFEIFPDEFEQKQEYIVI